MSLSSIPASIGGTTKQVLVALDSNGDLAPAHLLINSSGVEIGTTAQPLTVTVANPDSTTVTVGNFPAGPALDATLQQIKTALANLISIESPYQGRVAFVLDTAQAAQRAIEIVCTTAGNVSVTYADGSQGLIPVNIGLTYISAAITTVHSSSTTAVATYGNMK